ncbi:bifunctional 4-hydroxy-2-oxoglutarate aldolase/2-dehydro-3-deoxy-phosphogluconate aldolase [Paeniglutamicibacter psychrophenolicus]|uniref:2-dehydro-3-deoxyphosphogluconate aldolase/(4S)-4-hydroxy-2-oxoglutarate aldolase n=1 Tax=Paeniglutamicibacter psychrophenolicus TaxID=257454 RepID=A0ABS4WAT3_9MICC|nr:bifunctional 4-hydroxy-2-oxoglutarate aldolase/2-dehydro-3-deoxy-phosphogluconate aldolase [Paeniglutamicibacter psychrophenolicus]MBP2373320.1 2-dehydro-3-deoxyphosphogluconate aldolase/(4S)-4-hydroxy-2-oxoglutarate aldolase [Paeniglutamicibacter psychrophenolicus]
MNTPEMIELLHRDKALAVVRAEAITDAAELCGALVAGGINAVEFTFTIPGMLTHLARAAETVETHGAIVGAGTVLHADQARAAIDAGARFIIAPGIRPEVAEVAVQAGIPFCLGAMTPTEVAMALDLGSAMVKIFPAATMGSRYLMDLQEPYPGVRLLPTGGITLANANEFLDAGALAVCVDSAVLPGALVAAGQYEAITGLASEFTAALH